MDRIMKKRKRLGIVLAIAVFMVLASASAVLAAGSGSTEDGRTLNDGSVSGATWSSFQSNVKGQYSTWSSAANAIEVPAQYATSFAFRQGKSQPGTLHGMSNNGPSSFRGGNSHNSSTGEWERNHEYPGSTITGLGSYSVDLSGTSEPYILYRNYAYYQDSGKPEYVDIKVTVVSYTHVPATTKTYQAGRASYGNKYQYTTQEPIMFISRKCYGGFPSIEIYNIGDLRLRTEYFKAGTDTRKEIRSNVTYTDIDNCQAMSFRVNDVNKSAVTQNTRLCYTFEETSSNTKWATYGEKNNDSTSPGDKNYAVSFSYSGDIFYTQYVSNQWKGKDSGGDLTEEPDIGHPNGRQSYFGTSQYSLMIPKLPAPKKYVIDEDEPSAAAGQTRKERVTDTDLNNTSNRLDKKSEKITYAIKQRIPAGYGQHDGEGFLLNKFIIRDTFDSCLEIQESSIKIYREHLGEGSAVKDVTDDFSITVSGQKLTAAATAALLSDDSFYGDGYGSIITLAADVKIRDGISPETLDAHGHMSDNSPDLVIKNKAATQASAPGHSWDEAETNEVRTSIQIPKPKKNAPFKQVTDSDGKTLTGEGDEVRVTENTLRKPDNEYTYHVRHRLGSGENDIWDEGAYTPYWFFDSYKLTDKVEDLLIINDGAKVYEYTWKKGDDQRSVTGEKDVTGKFDISVSQDRKTITAAAKTGSLGSADFYNVKMYELRFNARIDTDKYDSEESLSRWAAENSKGTDSIRLRWPNKAKAEIKDKTDPQHPDTEDGKSSWSKETNIVHTNVWIPTGGKEGNPPGIILTKTTIPYEFQVGDDIPYTVTLEHDNRDAVAYKVTAKDTDFPSGFTIDDDSFGVKLDDRNEKRSGEFSYSLKKVSPDGGDGFTFDTDYIYPGEKISISFNGRADKTLNGKVVPNTAFARAWGVKDKDEESSWDSASTSVYINSPKISVEKEVTTSEKTIKAGETIFDMGCGSGTLAIPFARRGHRIVAADFSPDMLKYLMINAEEEGVRDMITPVQLDWNEDWGKRNLPVCDVAICSRAFLARDMLAAIGKLESVAARKVCLGLWDTPRSGYNRNVARAVGFCRPGPGMFAYILGELIDTGRMPELRFIMSPQMHKEKYTSHKQALEHFADVFGYGKEDGIGEEQYSALKEYLDEHLVAAKAGEVRKSTKPGRDPEAGSGTVYIFDFEEQSDTAHVSWEVCK